jgi:uncharacterized Zn finger protein (UPF0148 family)
MRYCSKCGEPLKDEAVFCPICGNKVVMPEAEEAPAETNEAPAEINEAPAEINEAPAEAYETPAAPKKRKKGGKVALIVALVAVGLVALLLIAGALLYFTGAYAKLLPASRLKLGLAEKEYVERALDDFFENYNEATERSENFEMKADLDVTADIELSDDVSVFSEAMVISTLLEKTALKVKLDLNDEHSNILCEAYFSNNPVLDARIIRTKDLIGLYVPLLDSKYYTATPETLAALIKDAAEQSGSDISETIPDVDADALSFERLDEQKIRKETMDVLKIMSGLSTRQNTEITRDHALTVAGKFDEKGVLYTITPSAEEYEKVINELADYLDKDGCYIAELANKYYSLIQTAAANSTPDLDFGKKDRAENISELLRENAKETAENLAEQNTKIEVFMAGNEILSQAVVYDGGRFVYDAVTRDKTEYKCLSYEGDEDEGAAKLLLENNIADKNKLVGRFTADVESYTPAEFGGMGNSKFVLDYNFDKTKTSSIGSYPGTAVASYNGEEIVSVTVTPVGDNMKHTLIIDFDALSMFDDIYAFDDISDGFDVSKLTLIVLASEGTGVEAPTGVEPTDISNYSTEELEQIVTDMFEKLSSQLINILT